MTSLSGIVSSAGGAFSASSITTKASNELQSLFAKLHMDAIASTSTASTAATTATATPATKHDVVTGIVSGLRSVLDGTMSAASAARSVGKLAASYGSGVGIAGLALHAVDKVA
jgi:hypothetical protein